MYVFFVLNFYASIQLVRVRWQTHTHAWVEVGYSRAFCVLNLCISDFLLPVSASTRHNQPSNFHFPFAQPALETRIHIQSKLNCILSRLSIADSHTLANTRRHCNWPIFFFFGFAATRICMNSKINHSKTVFSQCSSDSRKFIGGFWSPRVHLISSPTFVVSVLAVLAATERKLSGWCKWCRFFSGIWLLLGFSLLFSLFRGISLGA